MDSLPSKGWAIYGTLLNAANAHHAQQKAEISDIIIQSVNTAVEAAVRVHLNKAMDDCSALPFPKGRTPV
jgi:hypothetical protein